MISFLCQVNKDVLEAKTIVNLEKELEALNKENGRYDPKIKEIEARMNERLARIKALQAESNQIDDEVFGHFCVEIGVDNIRVYEERELAGQQETVKARAALEERKSRLNTQLEFEVSRDTLKSLRRWEREVCEHLAGLTNILLSRTNLTCLKQ
jgi:structural maintenance of chromosome 1